MKVLAIMGSPRKGQTNRMLNRFEKELKALGEIDFEYLMLRELNLQPCKGCANCLEVGEDKCPLKDDRDLILQKLSEADGVIFASPNYSLQVSGLMKLFLDRFAYIFHRPCFFGTTAMAFITQGVYGGKDIVKYINEVVGFWGMNICPGMVLTTPWGVRNPIEYPQQENDKINAQIKAGAARFYQALNAPKYPAPSLKRMFFFRLTRSAHKYSKVHMRDYEYFANNGWFDSAYFYETKIGLHKRLLGSLIDRLIASQAKKANA